MRIVRKTLLLPLLMYLLSACGDEGPSAARALSRVDSATQAASDTLRASMDTSSHKRDTVDGVSGDDKTRAKAR